MFSLEGKTALITGASGGIGGEIARALVTQGAVVGLAGRRLDALETLKADIGGHALVGDLSTPEGCEKLISDANEALGQIDILVNNAGLTRDGLAMRMKDDDWSAVIDVNLTGTFRLIRSAIKGMMKRRSGRIINMASVVGVMGNAGQANYAASKGGMIAMSKALAGELAPRGVTVNCVAPGFVETAMTADLPEKVKETMLTNIPTGRMGRPAEIAAAVAFLASDEASYLTGTCINVNGGMLML